MPENGTPLLHAQRLTALFSDHTGSIELIWFKGIKYVLGQYKVNEEYIVFGKPSLFNGRINIAHPEIDKIQDADEKQKIVLQGFYNTTEKMKTNFLNSKAIQKIMRSALNTPLTPSSFLMSCESCATSLTITVMVPSNIPS